VGRRASGRQTGGDVRGAKRQPQEKAGQRIGSNVSAGERASSPSKRPSLLSAAAAWCSTSARRSISRTRSIASRPGAVAGVAATRAVILRASATRRRAAMAVRGPEERRVVRATRSADCRPPRGAPTRIGE
jgi:hypothetical protein